MLDLELYEYFEKPNRELACVVKIGERTFSDSDFLISSHITKGLSGDKTFNFGGVFSKMVEIQIIDKDEKYKNVDFVGDKVSVSFGIKDKYKNFQYKKAGIFYVENFEINKKIIKLKAFDVLKNTDVEYKCNLTFPATVKQLFIDVCNFINLNPSNDNFINSDVVIKVKPVFTTRTCRDVLSWISELAAGFCICENEEIKIVSPATVDKITINDDNMFFFNEGENINFTGLCISQKGTTDYTIGENINLYHIIDNPLIQGNANQFGVKIFTVLSNLNLWSGTVKYNGNPCEIINSFLNINGKKFLPFKRVLKFKGGLSEELSCPAAKYGKKESKTKEKIINTIIKNSADLLVLDDSIKLKVDKNGVVNAINLSPEGISISGKKLHITAQTEIDNAVIGSANIRDVNAENIKVGTLTGMRLQGGSGSRFSVIDFQNGSFNYYNGALELYTKYDGRAAIRTNGGFSVYYQGQHRVDLHSGGIDLLCGTGIRGSSGEIRLSGDSPGSGYAIWLKGSTYISGTVYITGDLYVNGKKINT